MRALRLFVVFGFLALACVCCATENPESLGGPTMQASNTANPL